MGLCLEPAIIVTEYCKQGSLLDVIQRAAAEAAKGVKGGEAALSWLKRLNMMLDAAKGVLCLHAHKPPIVHRDLKSANFLVDEHSRVRVTDFGLSKVLEEHSGASSSSTMATMNPRWLSPEVLAGHRATAASDVFAFGVVMWELLTWEVPWGRRSNQWTIVGRVMKGERLAVPPAAALPGEGTAAWAGLPRYEALMRRCWAADPAGRPLMTEIIVELRALLRDEVAAVKAASQGGAERFRDVRPADQGECAICLAAPPTAQFIHAGS
jgi:serine/threonine protein kinase